MDPAKITRKDVFNFIVNFISVGAVFVFGAWAVRSYNAATEANLLATNSLRNAETANQLTLLSICGANPVRITHSILCMAEILMTLGRMSTVLRSRRLLESLE